MFTIRIESVSHTLQFIGSFLALSLLFSVVNAQENQETTRTGSIDHVTVYKGKALVSRMVEIPEKDVKQQRITVENLPAEVDGKSIYAEGKEDVKIRSVRYRARPVEEDVREKVRELDRKIKEKEREIRRKEREQETISNQKNLLKKLQNFTAPSADWELGHGVLDAGTIKSLVEFFFSQQESLDQRLQNLEFEKSDLKDAVNQLKRERSTITNRSSRTRREAVVSLIGGQGGSFELRYLVDNASWSPSYNLRAPAERDQVQLEYMASVHQMSGEDWNNVSMTLSTASPSLVSEPPTLSKLSLQLQPGSQGERSKGGFGSGSKAQTGKDYMKKRQKLQQQQSRLNQQRAVESQQREETEDGDESDFMGGGLYRTEKISESFDSKLNELSSDLQLLELSSGRGKEKKESAAETRRNRQQASVRYELSGRTSLPSRDDRQLIRITSREINASFYRVARPVLTEKVYEQADLTNNLDWVLLSGPSSSYLDGQFVGRGTVPTVSVGESFQAGFGIDSDLRSGRELVDREVSTQGGNKIVKVTYRLSLSNFSEDDKSVRLYDRLPVPDRNGEVRVTFLDADVEPAKTPADEDNRVQPGSDGIVRWDVTVPAGSTGDEKYSVNYTYSLEYAKNRRITK